MCLGKKMGWSVHGSSHLHCSPLCLGHSDPLLSLEHSTEQREGLAPLAAVVNSQLQATCLHTQDLAVWRCLALLQGWTNSHISDGRGGLEVTEQGGVTSTVLGMICLQGHFTS